MPPGDTYVVTFEKLGYFRYHNHANASHGGLAVVTGSAEREPLSSSEGEFASLEFEIVPEDLDANQYVPMYEDDAMLEIFLEACGPVATVKFLQDLDYLTGRFCHDRAHRVGRQSYNKWGTATFSLDLHGCQSGAVHGMTEALFADRGTASLGGDITALCAHSKNSFERHQCLHGVGHGLMAWTTYELLDTLELCDVLTDWRDMQSCYSGVFMENDVGSMATIIGHTLDYISDEDAHYLCDVLDERYVAQCYFFHTSHMLKVWGNDFPRLARACAEKVPEVAKRECFVSYGRDIGDQTRQDQPKATELCGLVTEDIYRMNCVSGAVFNWFWQKPEQEQTTVARYCASLAGDPVVQEGCYRTIIDQARIVLPTLEMREHFCSLMDTPAREQNCLERIASS